MHPRVQCIWNRLAAMPCADRAQVTALPGAIQQRILDDRCFEPHGAFSRMLAQQIPQAIAWKEDSRGRVYAYATVMPCTDKYYAYMPDRVGALQLGLMGVWVEERYRRQGHAREVLRLLGELLRLVPAGRFLISAEPSVLKYVGMNFPLHVLQRWARDQPSRQSVAAAVRAKGHIARGWWQPQEARWEEPETAGVLISTHGLEPATIAIS